MTPARTVEDRDAALRVARESYRAISLYAPDRAPCRIDLSDNTNTWGVAPAVEEAIRDAALTSVTRYPNLYAAQLKEALGGYLGVAADRIVTGCGSDDVLDSAIRAFAEPGDAIVFPEPSFAMIPIFARMNGLRPVPVRLTTSLDLDAEGMLAPSARIVYICSPNNPTGGSMSRGAVERIVERSGGVVIIDEAYAEFAGEDFLDLVASSERVLVARTMSKAFGLAGLRVGYATGAPALVAEVEKSRGPYKVNALAERAALAALGEGLAWARSHVTEAIANRERLASELRSRGLSPLPSTANFVLVPVAAANERAKQMRALGVAVRPFEGLPPLGSELAATGGSALRISVGPWEMIEAALGALDTTAGEAP
ncbi:MAG TPA: aminotransferase class I/II-fold pyridoxal phosphate-dependent enzyme [Gemmatimonadaceae bacterium]|nr:aminotransferase class I/II-fold pyridoxal phosphate-dependent enzyme [Gemmatimonadaceae bacterium]